MKKRPLFVTLVLFVLIVSSVTSFASEFAISDNMVTQEEYLADYEEALRLVDLGERIASSPIRLRYAVELYVPILYQTNSQWKNTLMPCKHVGHTYGAVGCAMTSYAMVINSFYFSGQTPVTVAERYGAGACDFSLSTLCSQNGINSTSYSPSAWSGLQNFIVGSFDEDKPVVIRLRKSNGAMHFVVAYGYAFNGANLNHTIWVNDPEGNYATLNSFYSNGWYADHAAAISR